MEKIILLIDDDQDEFDFYIEALHELRFPCNLIYTKSAIQALRLLRNTVPDFIFIDFNMPQMNGLRCIEEIKKIKDMEYVPIILSSSNITDELTKNAMATGASFCIRKSHKVLALAETLQQIFATYTQFKGCFTILKNN
jgi:CheY-like chemotaxis protein